MPEKTTWIVTWEETHAAYVDAYTPQEAIKLAQEMRQDVETNGYPGPTLDKAIRPNVERFVPNLQESWIETEE